jgi:hypothetical protein
MVQIQCFLGQVVTQVTLIDPLVVWKAPVQIPQALPSLSSLGPFPSTLAVFDLELLHYWTLVRLVGFVLGHGMFEMVQIQCFLGQVVTQVTLISILVRREPSTLPEL